jgi:hypothetical protein
MFCQNCRRDVQHGKFYYALSYGNAYKKVRQLARQMADPARQSSTRLTINALTGGSQQVFLCNDCVFTVKMKERAGNFLYAAKWFFGIACLVGAVLFIPWNDPITHEIILFATALIMAYALSLFMTSFVEKKRADNRDFETLSEEEQDESGSKLAIALNRSRK